MTPQTASSSFERTQDSTRRLKAAWGAARFVSWQSFTKYFMPNSGANTPDDIARIDRIFEDVDVNAMIEARLAALEINDTLEATHIRGRLLAAGVELIDERAPVSGTITSRWKLAS